MTVVATYSYTHSVTYVADNILKSLKDVIRLSGLDPDRFVANWEVHSTGVRTWLESGDLESVTLEIYDPRTNDLVTRWDVDIVYGWGTGDGSFWTDTDQLRYALRKAGVVPSEAKYELVLRTKQNRPDVPGWSRGHFRSTAGFVKQSLGSTVQHNGLAAQAGYWRMR
jgi:hypothetical protein